MQATFTNLANQTPLTLSYKEMIANPGIYQCVNSAWSDNRFVIVLNDTASEPANFVVVSSGQCFMLNQQIWRIERFIRVNEAITLTP